MKPAQLTSLLVTALLAVCGVAMKFTGLFPAGVAPYLAIATGTVGPFLITMLPPVLATPFSDHVEHELARVFQFATFGLGVIPAVAAINHAPSAVNDWCAFAAACLTALGVIFLPKAQPKTSQLAKTADAVPPPPPGSKAAVFLPWLAVGLALAVSACTFAQFKQDLHAAEAECGAQLLNDVMQAIEGGAAAVIADVVAAVKDAACIYEAIGAVAAKNGGALTAVQKENAAKLVVGVKRKLGVKVGELPPRIAALLVAR